MKYYSQYRQDEFVDKCLFNQKENGVFVEIGAHNGISFSNSFFFEKNRSWTGICVEPMPRAFNELSKNRKCTCVNACISDTDGEDELILVEGHSEMLSGLKKELDPRHCERIQTEIKEFGGKTESIKIKTLCFNNLMHANGIQHVDFCSIDVEGAEWKIIQNINFDKIVIEAISIENNYDDSRIIDFFASKGFDFVGKLGADQIFVRQGRKDPEKIKRACKKYNRKLRLKKLTIKNIKKWVLKKVKN